MSRFPRLALAPVVAALLFSQAPVALAAASIVGDSFQLGMDYQDAEGSGPGSSGLFGGTASATPGNADSALEADAVGNFQVNGVDMRLHARWIDADTVHVAFQGGAVSFSDLVITLSDLNFTDIGNPASILAATFNGDGGDGLRFNGFDEVKLGFVNAPTVTFTQNSVSMTFSSFTGKLVADGPIMEINLIAAAVPEPGTYALMLGGLAALGLAARRRRR